MSNFFEALNSRKPKEIKEVKYYLQYNKETGKPIRYTMSDEEPGDYIEIEKKSYVLAKSNVKVENGMFIVIDFADVSKLVISDSGTTCHKDDITIIANEGIKWEHRSYDD